MTGLAAAIGAPAAVLALRLATLLFPVPFALGPGVLPALFVAALGFGAAFSYGPARLAARLAPAEALRSE